MNRKKLLNTAVDLERRGHQYYSEHADETDNPFAERVLRALAAQELDHIEMLENLAEGIFPEETDDDFARCEDVESVAREVFAEFSRAEREDWELEDKSVYERARHLELVSIRLYSELAEMADGEAEREFLLRLVQEERRHLESIDNVQYYLENTGDWLAMDESRRWNWMNI